MTWRKNTKKIEKFPKIEKNFSKISIFQEFLEQKKFWDPKNRFTEFWSKIEILSKTQILIKSQILLSIMVQIINFVQKSNFFIKHRNFDYTSKLLIKNRTFWLKSKLLIKNWNFWSKIEFDQKPKFFSQKTFFTSILFGKKYFFIRKLDIPIFGFIFFRKKNWQMGLSSRYPPGSGFWDFLEKKLSNTFSEKQNGWKLKPRHSLKFTKISYFATFFLRIFFFKNKNMKYHTGPFITC